MSRIKPYAGTSQARLSQLIRSAQQPVLPSAVNFNFGAPELGSAPVEGSTTVQAEAYTTTRQDEPLAINYKRLSFDALKRLPPGELVPFDPITFPTTVHAILPQINAGLGLDLVTSEVEDTPLDTLPINGITVTITDTSLAWLPGDYFFPYTPNAPLPAARGENGQIPTDQNLRIRVLENTIS
ncbi:hypothetical protein [Ralstonia phage RP31]|uniref:Uncharacterized protein n=2 Tax=Ripduovirus RP12 TaxID=2560700 RepID=A0A1L7N0X6_9CAUD|nr:hypothetical protein FDH28_gp267 [Ralstonia phage RP12]BAW19128.1 hypothetical protein [Ralstonia phage RP12]BAW19414.1 hypothetical protein [Ralstonia phage RP31]